MGTADRKTIADAPTALDLVLLVLQLTCAMILGLVR